MKLNKKNIGQIWYPHDNSYSVCHEKGSVDIPLLAGMYRVEAKPCKIVSAPYVDNLLGRQSCSSNPIKDKHEFIDVEFEGKTYSILNTFHEDYDSMVASVKKDADWVDFNYSSNF